MWEGARNATVDEFVMQCTQLPRQPRRETPRRRAERGTESKEAEAHLAGYSRRVTPLAFIHRRVRPLDGWMVVANPDHLLDQLSISTPHHSGRRFEPEGEVQGSSSNRQSGNMSEIPGYKLFGWDPTWGTCLEQSLCKIHPRRA